MVEDLNSAQEFSKTQTCFLFDLQPSFNPSGAQNAPWIIHDPKQCGLSTHSTRGASQVLLAAPVGESRVTPVQSEGFRILRYENLCPLRRASLIAQLVRNLPAMRETWVRSWGWEDPLDKEKATHSSILAWKIPWTVL